MKELIKKFLPQFIWDIYVKRLNQKLYDQWLANNCPVPPPHLAKQKVISSYQDKYKLSTFIETGTYMGDMIQAQKDRFNKLISIELGEQLALNARKRFKGFSHIEINIGDSGKVLPEIMKNIHSPALFWLDGHYSAGVTSKGDKDCPIYEELDAIFSAPKLNHIILIDDARCFDGTGDYPTIANLEKYVLSRNPQYRMEIDTDVIRLVC